MLSAERNKLFDTLLANCFNTLCDIDNKLPRKMKLYDRKVAVYDAFTQLFYILKVHGATIMLSEKDEDVNKGVEQAFTEINEFHEKVLRRYENRKKF